MRNFKRMFVVNNGESNGWTGSTRTTFIVSIRDDVLDVTKKSGRDMFLPEIYTAIGRFICLYKAEYGEEITVYERKHPYRFVKKRGNTYIEVDTGDGFPVRKFLKHESCFEKYHTLHGFVYDFFDLAVAEGCLGVKDGFYYYSEEDNVAAFDMKAVRPRLVEHEAGWTPPNQRPSGVVPLEKVWEELKS